MAQPSFKQPKEIKLVAVGDTLVGKTCLLMSFAKNEYAGYAHGTLYPFTHEFEVDGHPVSRTFL